MTPRPRKAIFAMISKFLFGISVQLAACRGVDHHVFVSSHHVGAPMIKTRRQTQYTGAISVAVNCPNIGHILANYCISQAGP
jgi:hypothetical protein